MSVNFARMKKKWERRKLARLAEEAKRERRRISVARKLLKEAHALMSAIVNDELGEYSEAITDYLEGQMTRSLITAEEILRNFENSPKRKFPGLTEFASNLRHMEIAKYFGPDGEYAFIQDTSTRGMDWITLAEAIMEPNAMKDIGDRMRKKQESR